MKKIYFKQFGTHLNKVTYLSCIRAMTHATESLTCNPLWWQGIFCLGPNSKNIYLRVMIFDKNKQDIISTTQYLRKKTERLLACKTPFCLQPEADQRFIHTHLRCKSEALLLTFTHIISFTGHTKTFFKKLFNKYTMHLFYF